MTGAGDSTPTLDHGPSSGDHQPVNIELDERAGQVRVSDPRLIHRDRRRYARRLLEALCDRPGVVRAEVDLDSSSCRVDFDPGSAAREVMAGVFADAVRATSAGDPGLPRWRRDPGWSTLTAYRSGDGTSVWETHEDRPGRVRLLRQRSSTGRRSARGLAEVEGVESCRVSPWTGRIAVVCEPDDGRTLDRVERSLGGGPGMSAWRRWRYGALAGGSFAMTLVGLVIPGVPTVPFLLATSYYLARCSPRLDERLRRTVFLGPILREWEGHSALSWASKAKLIGLSGAVVLVTLALAPIGPVILVVLLVMVSISVAAVLRMPALPSEGSAEVPPIGRAPLALPAG